jgi:hypothetical protein
MYVSVYVFICCMPRVSVARAALQQALHSRVEQVTYRGGGVHAVCVRLLNGTKVHYWVCHMNVTNKWRRIPF